MLCVCSNVICLKIFEVRWGISPESQLSKFSFNEIEDGMAWESGYRVYNVMLQVCPKPVEPAALSSEA